MNDYPDEHGRTLLRVAREAIGYGLRHRCAPQVDVAAFARDLCEQRATFVTLRRFDQLRGGFGAAEARRALVQDVAAHAAAAAFSDPRFAPLIADELDGLDIHIAILQPPEPMRFDNEADLLAQLRPNIDGLVLEE